MNNWKVPTLTLALTGAALAVYSYFVLASTPLTAAGICALVTAISLALTPRETPYREAALSALTAYALNIARVLEELAAQPGAVYTPQGLVAVPLGKSVKMVGQPDPQRLIWKDTAGYFLILSMPSFGVEPGSSLEPTLEYILVDTLGLCDGVKVAGSDDRLVVELSKPRSLGEPSRFTQILGSLPAHLAAAVSAVTLQEPLRLVEYKSKGGTMLVWLERVGTHLKER
ncbi:MAG: hypothetical protein ABWK01_03865 [Infirmifilum sp.]